MRKKVILIVALAVLAAFAAVFAVLNIHAPGELSTWQKIEIEYHFRKQFDQEWGPWEDDGHRANNRYYGSDNGYVILLHGGIEFFGTDYQQTIGDCKFIMPSGQAFVLYAYKNGEFYLLNDVIEEGAISADALHIALQTHTYYER